MMSHPDPTGSSSCPWKTRWEAGLPAPTTHHTGHTRSWVGTHTHAPFLGAEVLFGAQFPRRWLVPSFHGTAARWGKGDEILQYFSPLLPSRLLHSPSSFVLPPPLHARKNFRGFSARPSWTPSKTEKPEKGERKEKKKQKNFSLHRADLLSVGLGGGVSSESTLWYLNTAR